jgi:hypothetical protein
VLDALNSISKDATIGFEYGHEKPPRILPEDINIDIHNNEERENSIDEEAEELLQLLDASNADLIDALVKLDAIEATETSTDPDPVPIVLTEPELNNTADPDGANGTREKAEPVIGETMVLGAVAEQTMEPTMAEYRARSGRIVRKPARHHDTEQAYVIVREIYEQYRDRS